MPTSIAKPPRQRRVQRFVVGMAMSVVAFVLERAVRRAVKRSEGG
jgi:hypothetical protein